MEEIMDDVASIWEKVSKQYDDLDLTLEAVNDRGTSSSIEQQIAEFENFDEKKGVLLVDIDDDSRARQPYMPISYGRGKEIKLVQQHYLKDPKPKQKPCLVDDNSNEEYCEKLEKTKRKLQEGYKKCEDVRKKICVIGVNEAPMQPTTKTSTLRMFKGKPKDILGVKKNMCGRRILGC